MDAGLDDRLDRIDSWAGLTHALRELHEQCGSPTYDAISAQSGLSKSAISGLIGRNPLRRPSEQVTLRFVSACLGCTRMDAVDAGPVLVAWRAAWRRLDGDEAESGTTAPPAAVVEPVESVALPHAAEPAGATRRGRAVPVLLAVLVLLVAALVAGLMVDRFRNAPAAADDDTSTGQDQARELVPTGACHGESAHPSDVRLGKVWEGIFVCPNQVSLIHEWADGESQVIGRLVSTQSWFACYAIHEGPEGPEVWYYTQGDDVLAEKHLEAWGFVPAKAITSTTAPDPGVERECDFSTGA